MNKVIRLSDNMIKMLNDYRNNRIERAKLLISSCPSYESDIKRYENEDSVDLVLDCIISALVQSEMDVKNLSECLKI